MVHSHIVFSFVGNKEEKRLLGIFCIIFFLCVYEFVYTNRYVCMQAHIKMDDDMYNLIM